MRLGLAFRPADIATQNAWAAMSRLVAGSETTEKLSIR
jgi:hypothetical protein